MADETVSAIFNGWTSSTSRAGTKRTGRASSPVTTLMTSSWIAIRSARRQRQGHVLLGGRLAGGDEFTLYAVAVRDVAYCGRDEHPIAIADWAQADLDRKLGTVATSAEELKADPHGSYAAVDDEALMVCHMASTETLRHQTLDALASQILRSISEKSANLVIAKDNISGRVDDDHGIRRRLQGAADQFGRQHYG